MAKEFRFHEHNFQNNPGDTLLDMNKISCEGWEIEAVSIGFPYAHVLWSRDVTAKVPADSGSEQLKAERDQAREVARQLKAERDQLREEVDALKGRLEPAEPQPGT